MAVDRGTVLSFNDLQKQFNRFHLVFTTSCRTINYLSQAGDEGGGDAFGTEDSAKAVKSCLTGEGRVNGIKKKKEGSQGAEGVG